MERAIQMREMPRTIQTPADLEFLFSMACNKSSKQGAAPAAAPIAAMAAGLNVRTGLDESLAAETSIESELLARELKRLIGLQYHRVPILATSGKKVTTRYFPEIADATATADGQKIVSFSHIETLDTSEDSDADGTMYETTEITLSAAPSNKEWLSVHMPDNRLVRKGFDPAKITAMLETLEQEVNHA